ncbi:DUF488 domain-containing protein [Microbacterium phosphatis]|uniref:DUF488 domain-containing protein n=1 Tax=Microbacterium phosphatis TaxID=3140248 RepID=UPI0031409139
MPTTVYTIGHSTHSIEEFLAMLGANGVETVADVRTVAGSRHNPQFGELALSQSLSENGLGYARLTRLGGLRHTPVGHVSENGAWRNKSFRSYADYMQTPDFAQGIEELLALAGDRTVAIMCAEAVPWRCHRSLIGDALLVRHVEVRDIMSATSTKPHSMTSFAAVDGQRVWYPAEESAAQS